MKKLMLAAVLCVTAASVFAAEPTVKSLERLMEVQDFDKLLDDSFKQMSSGIMNNPAVQKKLEGVPAAKQAAVRERMQQYFDEQFVKPFHNRTARAEIRRIAIDGMRKVYTQEEVDAMIQFYGSPVGKSIMAKMPKYMEVSMSSLSSVMAKHMNPDAEAELDRDINKIICGKPQCNNPNRK